MSARNARRRGGPGRTVVEALEGRRLLSGSVDVIGGGGGVVLDSFTHGTTSPAGNQQGWIAIQDNATPQRLIVAATVPGGDDVVLSRYNLLGGQYVHDVTFGGAAGVVVDLGGMGDVPRRLALDASGDIYVAGTTTQSFAFDEDMAVAKVSAEGEVKWSTRVRAPETAERVWALAVSDSGEVALGAQTGLFWNDFVVARIGSDGALVNSFGVGGLMVDSTESIDETFGDLVFDGAGNVIAGGTVLDPVHGDYVFLVRTYHGDDGTAVGSERRVKFFNVGGIGSSPAMLDKIGLDSVGNVVAVGHSFGDFVLARFAPAQAGILSQFRDQTLETSVIEHARFDGSLVIVGGTAPFGELFSSTYELNTPVGPARTSLFSEAIPFFVQGISVSSGGVLAVAGFDVNTTSPMPAPELKAGTVDADGQTLTEASGAAADLANVDVALAAAIDNGGNTYSGGYRMSPGGTKQAVITRHGPDEDSYVLFATQADSAWVTSIVIDGHVLYAGVVSSSGPGLAVVDLISGDVAETPLGYAPAADLSAPTRVAVHPNGNVVIAATVRNGSQDDVLVGMYRPSGTSVWETVIDVRTAAGGLSGTSTDAAGAVVVLPAPDESIVVGGASDGAFLLLKLAAADGMLVSGFDGDGITLTDIGATSLDGVHGLALQELAAGDVRIVAAGQSDGLTAVARYLLDEGLDPSFGTGGTTVLSQATAAGAQGLAIDASDRILLAGSLINADDDDFVVARLDATGAVDSSFGSDGTIVHDFGSGHDTATLLTLDGETIVVGGFIDAGSGGLLDIAVLRIDLDAGGGTGDRTVVVTGEGAGAEGANDITVWSDRQTLFIRIDGGTVHEVPLNDPAAPVVRIIINAGEGDDSVVIAGSVTTAVEIHGGTGSDMLLGGMGDDVLLGEAGGDLMLGRGGNDVFVGGAGNDVLIGGRGRDVLIGGAGADLILGNQEQDILVAGFTAHDADVAALQAIRQIWGDTSAAATYEARVAALRASLLSCDGPGARVFDDGAVDILSGNGGRDWLIFNQDAGARDLFTDRTAAEFRDDLDLPPD